MSKIICDVCGASYDDAAGACPLCGWHPGQELDTDIDDFDTDMLDAALADAPAAPVKKAAFDYETASAQRPDAPRKAPAPVKKDEPSEEEDEEEEEEKSGSNIFLVIILIILILALLGVSGWLLYTKILKPDQVGSDNNKPAETTSYSQTAAGDRNTGASGSDSTPAASGTQADPVPSQIVSSETVSAEPSVPCTNLTLVGTMDKLTFAGQYWRLMVRSEPTDTTDTIVYKSGDESIVTIDEYGRVTAVGEGTTTITVTCGDQRLETTAVVDFGSSETTSSATAATATGTNGTAAAGTTGTTTAAAGNGSLKLTYHGKERSDFTLTRRGIYISLELDGVPVESATWRTSDSSVATVNNGNVTAIGRGECVITATYNGQTVEAVVRCKW